MNTINTEESSRPLGFWLTAVDRLMAAEFASAFASEGITRRDWRLLNVIDGTVPAGHPSHDRPVPAHKLGRLIELGWVTDAAGPWSLTDSGRAAKERLGAVVDGIRAKVTDAVPAGDLATTMATLEQLARAFGWAEETPLPRRHGKRGWRGARGFGPGEFKRGARGFGPGEFGPRGREFGHGGREFGPGAFPHGSFGPGAFRHGGFPRGGFRHGFGDGERGNEPCGGHGFARDHEGHGDPGGPHGHRGGRFRARFARFAQGAYERGFDAGFTRGRSES